MYLAKEISAECLKWLVKELAIGEESVKYSHGYFILKEKDIQAEYERRISIVEKPPSKYNGLSNEARQRLNTCLNNIDIAVTKMPYAPKCNWKSLGFELYESGQLSIEEIVELSMIAAWHPIKVSQVLKGSISMQELNDYAEKNAQKTYNTQVEKTVNTTRSTVTPLVTPLASNNIIKSLKEAIELLEDKCYNEEEIKEINNLINILSNKLNNMKKQLSFGELLAIENKDLTKEELEAKKARLRRDVLEWSTPLVNSSN